MRNRIDFLLPIASPAPYLLETIESIKAQSYPDWGVVAVLDGPDAQVERVLEDALPRERLTIVALPKPSGLAVALNQGLRQSGAEFIARIDADDVNLPDRLRRQLAAADRWTSSLVVGGSATLIDSSGTEIGELRLPSGPDIRRRLLTRNQIVHSSALIRREALDRAGGYNSQCSLREDYELWLRLAALGPLGNVAEPVVKYRLSDQQVSQRVPPRSSLTLVGAARLDAASALGASRPVTRVRQWAWTSVQAPGFQSRFGRLGRARR